MSTSLVNESSADERITLLRLDTGNDDSLIITACCDGESWLLSLAYEKGFIARNITDHNNRLLFSHDKGTYHYHTYNEYVQWLDVIGEDYPGVAWIPDSGADILNSTGENLDEILALIDGVKAINPDYLENITEYNDNQAGRFDYFIEMKKGSPLMIKYRKSKNFAKMPYLEISLTYSAKDIKYRFQEDLTEIHVDSYPTLTVKSKKQRFCFNSQAGEYQGRFNESTFPQLTGIIQTGKKMLDRSSRLEYLMRNKNIPASELNDRTPSPGKKIFQEFNGEIRSMTAQYMQMLDEMPWQELLQKPVLHKVKEFFRSYLPAIPE